MDASAVIAGHRAREAAAVRVLVIEDSASLRESLRLGLGRSGFSVDTASDGSTGLAQALREPYDAIVLDLLLPGLDGLSVLRKLRETGSTVDVLILSAKDAVADRVKGLELGADDYLVKPFAFEELVARLSALDRRRHGRKSSLLEIEDLVIDTAARAVSRGDRRLDLTAREYLLLKLLALRHGETVSRIEIEDKLYGLERFPNSNVVASAISILRTKLGDPPILHTRRGLGYVLGGGGP